MQARARGGCVPAPPRVSFFGHRVGRRRRMSWKKILLVGIFAMVVTAGIPAHAGTIGVYGAFWDTDDADSSWGGGVRMGFDFLKWMELEFHGTYYPNFGGDVLGSSV